MQYILAIQIQAIQCASVQSHCFEKTGLARLVTNIVGMVLVVAFNQMNYA